MAHGGGLRCLALTCVNPFHSPSSTLASGLTNESQGFCAVRHVIQHLEALQRPRTARQPGLLEVADQGAQQGIDIRVFDPVTQQLRFEIVTLDPDSCPLIGKARGSDASFRAFCNAVDRARNMRQICLSIQFCPPDRQSPVPDAESEDRNTKVHRMVEDIADEITTYLPGSLIEIGMLHDGGSFLSLG
jgi:hypothetical protein